MRKETNKLDGTVKLKKKAIKEIMNMETDGKEEIYKGKKDTEGKIDTN